MRTHFAAALAALSLIALAASPNADAQTLTTISGASGNAIAVNSNAHRVFMADTATNRVYAVLADRSFSANDPGPVGSIAVGRLPRWIAVDATANRVYVANDGDGTLTVINGDNLSILATVAIGGAGPIAVDERNNKVYVIRRGKPGSVVAIDGSTYVWSVIDTASLDPQGIAVDGQLGRLFVSYAGSGDVRAIDTVTPTGTTTTRSVSIPVAGHPSLLALNPGTHRVYVMSDDPGAMLTVIDGSSLTSQSLSAAGHGGTVPTALAVNAAGNSVYAAFGNDLVVLDATGNTLTFVRAPNTIAAMTIDSAANRISALAGTRTLFQVEGATRTTSSLTLPIDAFAIGMDTSLQKGYIAGNGALQFTTGTPAATPLPRAIYEGLWWNSPAGSESGWGLDVAQQGNKVFATWFTYDEGGHAAWFVMPDSTLFGDEEFSGPLYRVTGPSYTGSFDSSQVATTPVGSLYLRFADRDHGVMIADVNGTRVTKSITRQLFGKEPTCAAGGSFAFPVNRTDLWWSAPPGGESGWGVFLTQQDLTIFVTWYTYDTDGKPVWFVGSNITLTGNQTYSGTLYRTWGPPFSASPWDSGQVTVMPVGSITFSFADESNGTFTYNIGGLTGTKAITRQMFSSPATVCN